MRHILKTKYTTKQVYEKKMRKQKVKVKAIPVTGHEGP
jgi:hypothetical protein